MKSMTVIGMLLYTDFVQRFADPSLLLRGRILITIAAYLVAGSSTRSIASMTELQRARQTQETPSNTTNHE